VNILLTGGTGSIGRYVLPRLVRERHSVVVLSRSGDSEWLLPNGRESRVWRCNLLDEAEVRNALWRAQPEVILHLGAHSTTKGENDPCRITRVNVLGTHHLLSFAPDGCRFVFASSATVYGDNTSRSMPGYEGLALTPTSPYGATKAAGEALVGAYTALEKVRGVSLRLVANAGAGATHGLVMDLARKLMGPREELELIGDAPGSCKPFLYVEDAVAAILHFAFTSPHRGPVNISPLDSITVEEVAEIALEEIARKPVRWLGAKATWAGDNRQVHVNPRLAHGLGWRPRYGRSADAVRAAFKDIRKEMQ
jgi:UDP-glucose 4-epimerase